MILHANYIGDAGRLTNEKGSEKWLICDLSNKCICPECISKDVDLNEDFFCDNCPAGNC